MPLLGVFVLISALAQQAPPEAASREPSGPAVAGAVGDGTEVPVCPEEFRPPTRVLRLIEVPDGPNRLADQAGGLPGRAPGVPQTCVMPAR